MIFYHLLLASIKDLLWRGIYIHKGEANNLQWGYCLGKQTMFTYAVVTNYPVVSKSLQRQFLEYYQLMAFNNMGLDSILHRKGRWNVNGYIPSCNFHQTTRTPCAVNEKGEYLIFQFWDLRISLMLPHCSVNCNSNGIPYRHPEASFHHLLIVRPCISVTTALLTRLCARVHSHTRSFRYMTKILEIPNQLLITHILRGDLVGCTGWRERAWPEFNLSTSLGKEVIFI